MSKIQQFYIMVSFVRSRVTFRSAKKKKKKILIPKLGKQEAKTRWSRVVERWYTSRRKIFCLSTWPRSQIPFSPFFARPSQTWHKLRTNNSLRDNRTNRTNLNWNPLPPVPGEELWIGGVGPRPQEWPGGYPGDLGESLARGRGS